MTPAHPRLIFLCSGHMIDKPGRDRPRFPPECEPRVARAIDDQLAALGAGPGDLAITQGACGADLLFAEALLAKGVALHLHLPLDEDDFLARTTCVKPCVNAAAANAG